MKRLVTLNNPRMAQAFIDYMASRQIDIEMMPEGEGQFALWLTDSQHEVEAEAELKQFLANPSASKYSAASWDVADTRKSQFHYASPSIMGMIKAKAGPVTLLIMTVCAVIYGLQMLGFGNGVFALLHFPAFEGQQWQLWRWVSHALLHFSVTHIIFNLLWWWQLGGDIERRLGSGKLLQIFVVSAALSGAGQFYVEGANFGGLSGVVYALLGYLWVLGYRLPHLGLTLPKSIIGFMLVWLVLGFVQPFMAIANTAHLAGLLVGMAIALFDSGKQKYQQQA
ncbi:rhomboid family intramembrane serine protease GlpG [Vibrio parahaemolyticus]|uniref:rhomboid family intramembrane serine protease GlpG n=1 Tax=Vibrio parahaemolyticus TaxID=670 RepID=UPI001121D5B5|nr:rhomboid family intramembrane serine protease GlpG [Vibrio parahaemolyticus]MBE4039439.1 rhomboid family intramembrane serine protease GlpG [Vibrio parahaemolyticus]TOP41593.1 rhomboid family intramembrane serine protease GlpG [Vibrio parahaemolyticus]HCE1934336.1 rhomboid family intramembrane serine protease GlpG [Vibrio parahaemolyticus]HCG8326271.1 rhomboid family intramembrane serine protease GlpG [Vibrio parahaemolyticus]HCH0714981.1 rhomboid family intramembrane serine protease GlpG [